MAAPRAQLRSSLAAANRQRDEETRRRKRAEAALAYLAGKVGNDLVDEALAYADKYPPVVNAGEVTS